MKGNLVVVAIVFDLLIFLTGGISGARQFLAWGSAAVFFVICFMSFETAKSLFGRLIASSVSTLIALGILVAPVASCVRDAQFHPSDSSINCEAGIGGQVICSEEP